MLARKWAVRLATSISTAALLAATGAQAQDTAEVEIRAGGVASTSPFYSDEEGGLAFSTSLEALPRLRWLNETGSITLDGRLRYEQWLEDYGSTLSGNIGLGANKRLSETLDVFGSARFQSLARSAPDLLIGDFDEVEPVPTVGADVTTLDPTIGIDGLRRNSANATIGLRKALSSVSQLTTSVTSDMNWFDGFGFDYRTTALNLEYQQAVAPNFALLFSVTGAKSDYLDQVRGDGTYGSAMAGFETQISPTGTLTASAGIAIADVETGLGTSERGEFFVAQADFCEEFLQGKACLGAARQTRPTTLGGASTLTSANFGWSRAFDEGEDFSINVRYSEADATLASFDLDTVRSTKFLGVSANYRNLITDRFGLFVSPSALKLFDDTFDRKTNFQVLFGLSYIFGR